MTSFIGGALGAFGGLRRGVADKGGRASARFYLNSVVFPLIEVIAKKERVTLAEQVSRMIARGETIGSYASRPEFRRKLDETLGNPAACFLLGKVRPHLNRPEQEIRDSVPWWIERIGETQPDVCSVIRDNPGGERWLGDVFIETLRICGERLG